MDFVLLAIPSIRIWVISSQLTEFGLSCFFPFSTSKAARYT